MHAAYDCVLMIWQSARFHYGPLAIFDMSEIGSLLCVTIVVEKCALQS